MKKNNLPLVTIGIPAYNHEKYIGECIESIINQPYKNIELIIINDGSKDNTHEIIKSYENRCKKRFVRFIYINRENKGLSKTANEILALAKGKYFKLIASDDKLHEESIDPFIKELEKGFDIVFGKLILIDENNNILGYIDGLSGINKEYTIENFNICDALKDPPTNGSPWIIRTELLKNIGGFDEKSKIEDWELICRLLVNNVEKNYIAKIAAFYRIDRKDWNFEKNCIEKNKPYLGSFYNWLMADLYVLNKYKSYCLSFYKTAVKRIFRRNLIFSSLIF